MIDLFCIFTTGGLILWSKSFVSFDFNSILNDLIKTILMDEKRTQDFYIPVKGNGIILRWKIFNKSGIIFVVAYQQSFNVLYTDKLLDIVMNDFIKEHLPKLKFYRSYQGNKGFPTNSQKHAYSPPIRFPKLFPLIKKAL